MGRPESVETSDPSTKRQSLPHVTYAGTFGAEPSAGTTPASGTELAFEAEASDFHASIFSMR
jgi:hypothetical protein